MDTPAIYAKLNEVLDTLTFGPPVTHVYNPLRYAWKPFHQYCQRYGRGRRAVLLVGMNPGPFGMAQTGVPFGDVGMVRDWMGIEAPVGKPEAEHPKRPVAGFACPRGEVSGQRLWGWARDRFGTPESFFARFMVLNYCPLVFMNANGANVTPDKLAAADRAPLLEACDQALAQVVAYYDPEIALGVGRFAEKRINDAVGASGIRIGCLPHPSPASPAANRGWAALADRTLNEYGVL